MCVCVCGGGGVGLEMGVGYRVLSVGVWGGKETPIGGQVLCKF